MLGKIDKSLAEQAQQHCPHVGSDKKRKAEADGNRRPSKRGSQLNGAELTIVEREAKAIGDLCNYIEEIGGTFP